MNNTDVPIWEKYTLTIEEASKYFRIGEKKLREVAELSISTTAIGRSVGNPSCINDTKKMTQIAGAISIQKK